MKVGVIGYGSMGKMILEKISSNSELVDGKLYVANRNYDKIDDLSEKYILCRSNREIAELADVLIICVRPIDMKIVFEDIKMALREKSIIISLNGSITFEQLENICKNKIVKAIPSVTAEINKSQTLMCYNNLVNESEKAYIKRLFQCMGTVIELPESEMGMGSELVSCMPGFIAAIFNEICISAQKHTSIPPVEVVQMVLNTMVGTGQLMVENNLSYEEVISRVATKGGITEEGVKVIQGAFPKIADTIFDKTLEKRKNVSAYAQRMFGEEE